MMTVDVALVPEAYEMGAPEERVVVVDVLRASCTIVTALANGAERIIPVGSVEEAEITFHSCSAENRIRKEEILLCGERGGERIDGFGLGNSPREYTAEKVSGKTLIYTTTNGSGALLKAIGASEVVIGSFTNLTAVVDRIAGDPISTTILCAGEQGGFSTEDAVCAGMMVERIVGAAGGALELTDSAKAARILFQHHSDGLSGLMRETFNGKVLLGLGFEADLDLCCEVDRHGFVPVYDNGELKSA
jgi:2-phosphosulfolactate phosphatase